MLYYNQQKGLISSNYHYIKIYFCNKYIVVEDNTEDVKTNNWNL